MNASVIAGSAGPNGKIRIVSWALRILAAAAFLTAGGAKLAGAPMMVEVYNHIGIGQWFRYVTGAVEIGGAIALLVPPIAAFGGLLLAVTMACAVMAHLFVIGGNPVPAIVLLAITGAVAWLHRTSFTALLARLR